MPRRQSRSVSPVPSPRGADKPLLVLKVGTSTIMQPDASNFSLSNLGKLVDSICQIKSLGYSIIIVSSGAVGAGCMHLKLKKRPTTLAGKQAASAVGQCRMMRLYEDLFAIKEQKVAQLILTRTDLLDHSRFVNFKNTLKELLAVDVVPIINENDSLATVQLKFGDNDTLAAYVAVSLEAQWLFLLTDVDCLYTANPRVHPDARPVPYVPHVEDAYRLLDQENNEGTCWGSGGMKTKVVAAKMATACGIPTALCHGQYPDRVIDVINFVRLHAHSQEHFMSVIEEYRTRRVSRSAVSAKLMDYAHTSAKDLLEPISAPAESRRAALRVKSDQNIATLTVPREPLSGASTAAPSSPTLIVPAGTTINTSSVKSPNSGPSILTGGVPNPRPSPTDTQGLQHHHISHVGGRRRSRTASDCGVDESFHGSQGGSPGITSFDCLSDLPYKATIFAAQEATQHLRVRRRWVLSLPVRGRVYVDRGAAEAICSHKSLFAAGVDTVEGHFAAGEAVALCFVGDDDASSQESSRFGPGESSGESRGLASERSTSPPPLQQARNSVSAKSLQPPCDYLRPADKPLNLQPMEDREEEIARCLVNFSSDEIRKIKGARSNQFSDILGYECVEKEVASRQNIILVNPCRLFGCAESEAGCEHD